MKNIRTNLSQIMLEELEPKVHVKTLQMGSFSPCEFCAWMLHILSVYKKLPPLKFRYFEKYICIICSKSFFHDFGQQHIGLETFNSSTSHGTMVQVHHVQFVIFEIFED